MISRLTRLNIVKTARSVGSVHFGGSFSVVEILEAHFSDVIDGHKNFDDFISENTLILSKGHCGLAVYSMLTAMKIIPEDNLATYCKDDGLFIGHIKKNEHLGIGWSTGSLGHGLSVAMGIASAHRHKGSNHRVICILGDGEMHEGSNWEALLHLSHDDNLPLTIILDNNQFLSLDRTQNVRPLEPIHQKIEAFNLNVMSLNGHDVSALKSAMNDARKTKCATFMNANTLKGYGVSLTAGVVEWHAKRASEAELHMMERELTSGPL